jgi:hypothetical protein
MSAEDPIEQRVVASLNEDVAGFDAATLSHLNQARQRALDAGLKHRRFWHGLWLLAPLAAALMLLLWNPVSLNDGALNPSDYALFDDVEAGLVETSSDGLDAEQALSLDEADVADELEFYAWMLAQETSSAADEDA